MMWRKISLLLALLLYSTISHAQSVVQTGSVTSGHIPSWVASGIVQDAGTATAGKINSLGLYGNGGTPFCITNSASPGPFSGQYSQLCFGISQTEAYMNLNGYGGVSPLPFNFAINGTTVFSATTSGPQLPVSQNYILVGQSNGYSAPVPMSGDCTILATGAITCTKTLGVAFGSLATMGYDANFTSATGNLALTSVASGSLLANSGATTAEPTATTLSALMDRVFGSTQGSVVYRGATVWSSLGPGANGTYLQSGGASANPSWTSPSVSLGTVRTSTSGNPTILGTDFMLVVNNTVPAATTVYLPAAPTGSFICVVKDGAGNANTYNITVSGNGNNIDGQSTQLIRTNYGSLNFAWNGTQWNIW